MGLLAVELTPLCLSSNCDSCVTYLLVYVNDLILTGNQDHVLRAFIARLNNEFAIKDLGELNYFLGLEVSYTTDGLFLNQSNSFIRPRSLTIKRSRGFFITLKALLPFVFTSLAIRGPLSLDTRMQTGLDVLRLVDPRMSISAAVLRLVSWSAKMQPTVSRSSCESEYRAMANTAAEIIWITHLLCELHALPLDRPTLLCDNRSALFLTQNPISHKRVKHIDLDYHFIRELVSSGKLHTRCISTKLQVADIFTKSLPKP
ncbi:hypothetical protein OSB04_015962 [Centaurea solstitialis]|uniref:Reverse transcriptase Ty1/copia-type domain-containing protein n=1 Tax=Centaurea solstitialis TaxID=347529 RepID=A0AA38W805_9ASTR|nr:hypothetical protein OSB04_015962 [Centaurea solstitialis]